MAAITGGEGSQGQKGKSIIFMYAYIACAAVIYFVICVLLEKYGFKPGQHGFAPFPPEKYGLVKSVLQVLCAVEAAFIVSVRLAVNSGEISGISGIVLNGLARSTADDAVVIMNFTLTMTSFCMSIGIYGLLLFLMNGVLADTYLFFAVCEVLILLFIPSPAFMEKIKALRKK